MVTGTGHGDIEQTLLIGGLRDQSIVEKVKNRRVRMWSANNFAVKLEQNRIIQIGKQEHLLKWVWYGDDAYFQFMRKSDTNV